MNIIIRRPKKKDIPQIKNVFFASISQAFKDDGIDDRKEGILEEVAKQLTCLKLNFNTKGEKSYYLIAEIKDKIIGTIAYKSELSKNNFIRKNLQINLNGIPEITSVYVLPNFQNQGIGSLLFNAILLILIGKNIQGVCMDGGYQKSIKFWTHKIGKPNKIIKNYWGKNLDQVFWYRDIKDIKIQFVLKIKH